MATIPQILMHMWPGNEWRLDEDDYDTLVWLESNKDPKPTEAEIRSHSDEVDRMMEVIDVRVRSHNRRYETK
jgi:hypothetical protein